MTDVIVIGGGLAGSAVAYFLSRQNLSVIIIDEADQAIQPGSSVPIGVLKPHFSVDRGLSDQLYTAGFNLTYDLCQELLDSRHFGSCGLIRFLGADSISQRYVALLDRPDLQETLDFLDPKACSHQLGFESQDPALLFHVSAWVSPKILCESLQNSSNHIQKKLLKADRVFYQEGFWHVLSEQSIEIARAPICVFACGAGFGTFSILDHLPLRLVPGQMSLIQANQETEHLSYILNHQSTLTPAINGFHALSGSFRASNPHYNVDPMEHIELLKGLLSSSPELLNTLLNQPYTAWVGVRVSTPDYLPCVGPLADYETFMRDFQGIALGRNKRHLPPVQYLPGCYVSVGHGARGLSGSLISGAIIAGLITGNPWEMDPQVAASLRPERFWIRELKKSGNHQGRS